MSNGRQRTAPTQNSQAVFQLAQCAGVESRERIVISQMHFQIHGTHVQICRAPRLIRTPLAMRCQQLARDRPSIHNSKNTESFSAICVSKQHSTYLASGHLAILACGNSTQFKWRLGW